MPAIGAETICASVHLMSQLFGTAMRETPPIGQRSFTCGFLSRGCGTPPSRHVQADGGGGAGTGDGDVIDELVQEPVPKGMAALL